MGDGVGDEMLLIYFIINISNIYLKWSSQCAPFFTSKNIHGTVVTEVVYISPTYMYLAKLRDRPMTLFVT